MTDNPMAYGWPNGKKYILDRIQVDEHGCWIWQKSFKADGYGQVGRKPYCAHVLAWTLWRQKPGPGRVIRHLCHVRACCNPFHLAEGSQRDNWHDSQDRYTAANNAMRGRAAPNRQKVLFRGCEYDSLEAARIANKVGYKTLKREAVRLP